MKDLKDLLAVNRNWHCLRRRWPTCDPCSSRSSSYSWPAARA